MREQSIFINQLGYLTNGIKTATIQVDQNSEETKFKVIKEAEGICMEGQLSKVQLDEPSGMWVQMADFSKLTENGNYQIQIGTQTSYVFPIGDSVYEEVTKAIEKAFYLQRCGIELEEVYAGAYKHGVCHNTIATEIENEQVKVDVTGGWHDAGDYGRYTVAAATTLGHILYGYELFPDKYKKTLGIPESGNGIPDMLNECRFEYEWLLKMQKEDGSFYHKVATRFFPDMDVMPEEDKEELFLFETGTCATASTAAAMSIGARVFELVDKEFSARLKQSAIRGFNWIEQHKEFIPFFNPENVNSGEYGDDCGDDEIFWLTVEMYRLTGETCYKEKMNVYIDKVDLTAFGWTMTGGFGSLSYLLETKFGEDDTSVLLKNAFLKKADELVETAKKSGFATVLKPEDYIWGSTMVLLNYGIVLIVASEMSYNKKEIYKEVALEQIHTLFGKNANGISYVTGYGSHACEHIHHRPSIGDQVEACVPGLISGGPNKGMQDDAMQELLDPNTPPALCFVDDDRSYASNEITIYWNSPAVFVLEYFA